MRRLLTAMLAITIWIVLVSPMLKCQTATNCQNGCLMVYTGVGTHITTSLVPQSQFRIPGPQGKPGINGTNGVNGKDGAQGPQGVQGPQGIPGVVPTDPTFTSVTTNGAGATTIIVTDAAGKQWTCTPKASSLTTAQLTCGPKQ